MSSIEIIHGAEVMGRFAVYSPCTACLMTSAFFAGKALIELFRKNAIQAIPVDEANSLEDKQYVCLTGTLKTEGPIPLSFADEEMSIGTYIVETVVRSQPRLEERTVSRQDMYGRTSYISQTSYVFPTDPYYDKQTAQL